jgi:hypothetical protein
MLSSLIVKVQQFQRAMRVWDNAIVCHFVKNDYSLTVNSSSLSLSIGTNKTILEWFVHCLRTKGNLYTDSYLVNCWSGG